MVDRASVKSIVRFLKDFPNTPQLKAALIEWRGWYPAHIVKELSHNIDENEFNTQYQALRKLENALLRFPHLMITFIICGFVDAETASFWAREIGRHLPRFLAHGGVVLGKPLDLYRSRES